MKSELAGVYGGKKTKSPTSRRLYWKGSEGKDGRFEVTLVDEKGNHVYNVAFFCPEGVYLASGCDDAGFEVSSNSGARIKVLSYCGWSWNA